MWIKVRDYAVKNNIAVKNVYQKIKNKQLVTKKLKNVIYISVPDEDANNNLDDEQKKLQLDFLKTQAQQKKIKLDLQKEKLKNLAEDTTLKRLRQQTIKELYRRQFSDDVYECFIDSFSQLKNLFIELKLDKEKNDKLKLIFRKSIEKFRKLLKDKLKKNQDLAIEEQNEIT